MFESFKDKMYKKIVKIKNDAAGFRDHRYALHLSDKIILPLDKTYQGNRMREWIKKFEEEGNIVIKDVEALEKDLLRKMGTMSYTYFGTDDQYHYYLRKDYINPNFRKPKTMFATKAQVSVEMLEEKYGRWERPRSNEDLKKQLHDLGIHDYDSIYGWEK